MKCPPPPLKKIVSWNSRDLHLKSQKCQAREIGTLPNHKEAIWINFCPGALSFTKNKSTNQNEHNWAPFSWRTCCTRTFGRGCLLCSRSTGTRRKWPKKKLQNVSNWGLESGRDGFSPPSVQPDPGSTKALRSLLQITVCNTRTSRWEMSCLTRAGNTANVENCSVANFRLGVWIPTVSEVQFSCAMDSGPGGLNSCVHNKWNVKFLGSIQRTKWTSGIRWPTLQFSYFHPRWHHAHFRCDSGHTWPSHVFHCLPSVHSQIALLHAKRHYDALSPHGALLYGCEIHSENLSRSIALGRVRKQRIWDFFTLFTTTKNTVFILDASRVASLRNTKWRCVTRDVTSVLHDATHPLTLDPDVRSDGGNLVDPNLPSFAQENIALDSENQMNSCFAPPWIQWISWWIRHTTHEIWALPL